MGNSAWPTQRLLAACCGALLLAAVGCDGLVGVEGVIVEAPPGEQGDIKMVETLPEPNQSQARVIDNAWVELWTKDGGELLDKQEAGLTKDGSFAVSRVGPYRQGMRYLLKAGAPGYQTVSKEVQLHAAGGDDYALIQLKPVAGEGN